MKRKFRSLASRKAAVARAKAIVAKKRISTPRAPVQSTNNYSGGGTSLKRWRPGRGQLPSDNPWNTALRKGTSGIKGDVHPLFKNAHASSIAPNGRIYGLIGGSGRKVIAPKGETISGKDKMIKYKKANLHPSSSDKFSMFRKGNKDMVATNAGVFGVSGDAVFDKQVNDTMKNKKATKERFTYDVTGKEETDKLGNLFGVDRTHETDARIASENQSAVAKEWVNLYGSQDIHPIIKHTEAGSYIAGWKGSTGNPELDAIRKQKYTDRFNNPGGNTDEKYSFDEERIMRAKMESDGNIDGLTKIDQQMVNRREEFNQEKRNKIAGLGDISGKNEDSGMGAAMKMAIEQKQKQFDRADKIYNDTIKRYNDAKTKAENELRAQIKAAEKSEISRLISSGYINTGATGNELLSSQALRSEVLKKLAKELQDGLSEIENNYNDGISKAEIDREQMQQEAENTYYELRQNFEAEKRKTRAEENKAIAKAQKDLEKDDFDWINTSQEFAKLVGNNPEMVDAYAAQLRQELINGGITDPEQIDNIINALKLQASRELEDRNAVLGQKDRSNRPAEKKAEVSKFEKLSSGAKKALQKANELGLSAADLMNMSEDRRKKMGVTESNLNDAWEYLTYSSAPTNNYSGAGGVTSTSGEDDIIRSVIQGDPELAATFGKGDIFDDKD